jgi:putative tryptophan/tyrosine transport system substrate-binding protein
VRRREFIALLGGAAALWPSAVRAQQPVRMRRIGRLSGSAMGQLAAFVARLAALGYVEGRDFVVENRPHQGRLDRVPELAAELVRLGPDVIIAAGPEAVLRAVSAATASIPIVMLANDYDPVALGLVASLARPGGNVTGVTVQQIELTAKRVELLREAVPAVIDIAVFSDAFTTEASEQMHAAAAAADQLGLRLISVVVPGAPPYDFAAALETARRRGAGAVLALMSPGFFLDRLRFVEEVSRHRMPASFESREFAEAGGLMSYGANQNDMNALLADYVVKIFKGAKPSDLPVAQPTRFELVINLKTAKALGLTVPQSILARADEVIE